MARDPMLDAARRAQAQMSPPDIVQRLRTAPNDLADAIRAMEEAAREIERLRGRVASLEKSAR